MQDVLQAALSVEHEVVYGYGVVGAWTSNHAQDIAYEALQGHQLRRDALAGRIEALGAVPTPAAVGYTLPYRVDSALAAARLGAALEDAAARAMWALVAASRPAGSIRRDAVRWLAQSADWLSSWRWASGVFTAEVLPGQPADSQPSTTPTSSPS
ncbi:MAG TPA: DUF4439 domain-containing protein [Mycobacteriales bacterium]|jgi:hypothetical protein|nr:DUF4439 domain-containing protein [Mycobacteriales bacterium]